MSPACSFTGAEFSKLVFANAAEKGLGQRKITGVFVSFFGNHFLSVISPCCDLL